MTDNVVLIANTNVLELRGLKNAVSGGFINTATVVATLEDKNGVDVAGETWPITLAYQINSDGCYSSNLNSALSLAADERYKLTLVAQGEGLDATWTQFIKATNRS